MDNEVKMFDIKPVAKNISKRKKKSDENVFNGTLTATTTTSKSSNMKIDQYSQTVNECIIWSVNHENDGYNYTSWNVLVNTEKVLHMERRSFKSEKSTQTTNENFAKTVNESATQTENYLFSRKIHKIDRDNRAKLSVLLNNNSEVRKTEIKPIVDRNKISKLKSKKQSNSTVQSELRNKRETKQKICNIYSERYQNNCNCSNKGQNVNSMRYRRRIDNNNPYRDPNNNITYNTHEYECNAQYCLLNDLHYKNECSHSNIQTTHNNEASSPLELAKLGTDQRRGSRRCGFKIIHSYPTPVRTVYDPFQLSSNFAKNCTCKPSEDLYFVVETDEPKIFSALELNEEMDSNSSNQSKDYSPQILSIPQCEAYEEIPQKHLSSENQTLEKKETCNEFDCEKPSQTKKITERTEVTSDKPVKRITLDEYRRRLVNKNVTLESNASTIGNTYKKSDAAKPWTQKNKNFGTCENDSDTENSGWESH